MNTQTEILDESENYFGYELASLSQRFFAVIVESLVLLIPLILILPGYLLVTAPISAVRLSGADL